MRSSILGFGWSRLSIGSRTRKLSEARRSTELYCGLVLVGLVVCLGIFGPLFANNPNQTSYHFLVAPGTHGFLLGSDQYGRDELSRIFWGIRTTLFIIIASTVCSLVVGTSIGLLSAKYKWFDMIAMRLMDILMAFPAILLAIGIMAMVGPGISGVIEAIAIVYIPIFARVARGPALEQMAKEYVEAAQASGVKTPRLLRAYILPNIWPIIIVQLSVAISDVILMEAALSYLGLGVLPPASSLGAMLKDGQTMMYNAPWMLIFPAVTIFITILGFTLLGDALRDILDVRQ